MAFGLSLGGTAMLATFSMPVNAIVSGSGEWFFRGFGDFNGDGKTDLFWHNSNTGDISAWLMNGDRVSQYTSYDDVPFSSGWHLRGFGDFNGDGKTNLFWYNSNTGETSAWLMNGDRVSQYTSYDKVSSSSGWHLRGFGDFNGDGKT
ncbi:MAG: FG-GAP repeat domain-containing protein, partial [Nitrososphaera sp.]